MNNYYEFTNLIDDKESFEYFNSLSRINLNNYANIFKILFQDNDYSEFYYSCKSLIEEINDIKIILNILKSRGKR